MTPLAVADTHALIFAASGHGGRLGRDARRFFKDLDLGRAALYLPTIVLVELSEAVWRGAVELPGGYDDWLDRALASSRYHVVDLTVAIVRRAHALYKIPERGDRLIAATAIELDCPLITRDPEIAKMAGVETIW